MRGPAATLMMRSGRRVALEPADAPAPPPSSIVLNFAKVEDSMKNMRSRNTTSTRGTSGRGLRIRAGASIRMHPSLARQGGDFFEVSELILGYALREEPG